MANNLSREKQLLVINTLAHRCSIRAAESITKVHRDTIMKLLVRVGDGCEKLLDQRMRNIPCKRLEFDELWSFVGKKQKNVGKDKQDSPFGDCYTFVALDPVTKLIPAYLVGKRNGACTDAFVADVRARIVGRPQISTDGWASYEGAIAKAFGAEVDYAIIVKTYEATDSGAGRYSPPKVQSVTKTPVFGEPEEDEICTSYVERSNLTMRTFMSRFARLSLGFSKKLENHRAAIALYFAYYNFCHIHRTIKCTPAMEAGITTRLWSLEDLVSAALDGDNDPS